ncbi:MAG: PQQ-binding-like beta-propeller repeat protein [Candidatus Eremiobacteraeota bacterium]|nr:PQQ-binding-like beta-propeller repeat protein [Candidatus Eremiobacteraeota bacterium]
MEISNIKPPPAPLSQPPGPFGPLQEKAQDAARETFQKSEPPQAPGMGKVLKKASDILAKDFISEAWSFSAESACILRTTLTPLGKVICQDQGKVYSLDGKTGTKEWELVKERGGMSGPSVGPDGTVYLDEVKDGFLVAVDGATGKEKWKASEKMGDRAHDHLDNIALKKDSALLVAHLASQGSDMKKIVRRLDSSTGQMQWERAFPSHLMSRMIVSGDESSLVVSLSDRIVSLDPKTGNSRWTFPTEKVADSLAPVVGPQGIVYFKGKDEKLHALDGATGKPLWKHPLEESMGGVPEIAPDGTLYLTTPEKIVALDGEKGTVKWEHRGQGRQFQTVGIGDDGSLHMYDMAGKKLMVFNGENGDLKGAQPCEKHWMTAEISPEGYLYYVDDHKVKALKVAITRELVEELGTQGPEGESAQKIEEGEGFVMIGGVRLPVRGEDSQGKAFYILGALRG